MKSGTGIGEYCDARLCVYNLARFSHVFNLIWNELTQNRNWNVLALHKATSKNLKCKTNVCTFLHSCTYEFRCELIFSDMCMHYSVNAEAVAFPPSEGAVSTAICAVCWHFHRILSCPAFEPHQHLHLTPRHALLPFHPPAPPSSSHILSSRKQWQSCTAISPEFTHTDWLKTQPNVQA